MNVPTLDELFDRIEGLYKLDSLKGHEEAFETHFRWVASGQAAPLLRDANAMFAAQCVCVLLEHVKKNRPIAMSNEAQS